MEMPVSTGLSAEKIQSMGEALESTAREETHLTAEEREAARKATAGILRILKRCNPEVQDRVVKAVMILRDLEVG